MPPKLLQPPPDGFTQGSSYFFNPTNAHGTHQAVTFTRWKLTVTTAPDNGGTLKTQTGWFTTPIATKQLTSLPANNLFYYGQIVYEKPGIAGEFSSGSNKFQSRP